MSAARKSYLKSTALSIVLLAASLIAAALAFLSVPNPAGPLLGALAAGAATLSAVLVAACLVVLARYHGSLRGRRDLFLALNASRDPDAIEHAPVCRRTRWRRWMARRTLGHDLIVGDLVEVRPWAEVRSTLDAQGCLDGLPFMPEMLAMCGRRARVFRGMHRLFDYRKSRRMRHMQGSVLLVGTACDGASHGGCEAACHTIWKADWLRRVEPDEAFATMPASSGEPVAADNTAVLEHGTRPPLYACQLTRLNTASQPLPKWSLVDIWRPLIAGNVAPAAFVTGWLTHFFNELQHHRGGIGFPAFEPFRDTGHASPAIPLAPGDQVIVRSPGEIRATLDDRLIHRGLGFEPDMLKHCGRRHCVQSEIRMLIDIVSGEMRTMKTPAYLLRGVHFSGERQLFNVQYEPLFWRALWLRRSQPGPVTDHVD